MKSWCIFWLNGMTWFSFMSLFCTVCGVFCHPDRAEWTCMEGGAALLGLCHFWLYQNMRPCVGRRVLCKQAPARGV